MATGLQSPPDVSEPMPSWVGTPPGGDSGRSTKATPDSPPASLRELAAIVGTVVVFDLWVYRSHGFAGYAAFYIAAAVLLLFGTAKPRPRVGSIVVGLMLIALAARMVWLGYEFLHVIGVALLVAMAVTYAGRRAFVLDVIAHGVQSLIAGFPALATLRHWGGRIGTIRPSLAWLAIVLPIVGVLSFGTIFVLANPDLATLVGERLRQGWNATFDWLAHFSPEVGEVVAWMFVALGTAGLLRPLVRTHLLAWLAVPSVSRFEEDEPLFDAPLYAACRNTLIALIGLFVVYLAFEFKTLWFKTFPKGFYYAGYAHEGAAWLTVALALTTLVLSSIFRGGILRDPRVGRLKRLAWAWSAVNLFLALAVYHRMQIYIDFNGMTRMRMVGLFGITAVVIGFLLCVWKIARDRDFAWLIERQLWTASIAGIILAILPIDPLIHTYNVRRILAGELAPAVQITEHDVDSGGVFVLQPLLDSENEIIREGIRALLAERALKLEADRQKRERLGWTAYQAADERLLNDLLARRQEWTIYSAAATRSAAWNRYKAYAYQWY